MATSGAFGDPFGGAVDRDDSKFEIDTFLRNFEALAKKAAGMNKAQRYDLQKRVGSAVRDFHLELLRLIESQK